VCTKQPTSATPSRFTVTMLRRSSGGWIGLTLSMKCLGTRRSAFRCVRVAAILFGLLYLASAAGVHGEGLSDDPLHQAGREQAL